MYSQTEFQASPSGVSFGIWGRDSGLHFDLSVECESKDDITTDDGKKYHGHLEHPIDDADCASRIEEIITAIKQGNPL